MFKIEDIKDPTFVKKLNKKELNALAADIRNYLIEHVAETGGHLASNLGVVELTIAMHYVFDSPKDKFIFDVGHQSYVHKILTGRASQFTTLRQFDGLSGYTCRAESVHDIWESGHSSTSISAQAGLIAAQKFNGETGRVIAVIGDSSISNGIAFEGLNFEGQFQNRAPIIILNDNKMGISKSVGALTRFLNKIRGTKVLRAFHLFLIKIFPSPITNFFHKIKRGIKGFIQSDNVFEDLGFDYYGPYEGNQIAGLIRILNKAKMSKAPVLIHVITRKGQGYEPAVNNMTEFHGIDRFNPLTGQVYDNSSLKSFSKIVSDELLTLRASKQFTVICPAMLSGSALEKFKESYPEDCYDVGIAEEHAVAMAAGMSLGGAKTVVSLYATFAQRAFDQILNDVCRQNLNVVFTIDRAGVVGPDGPTHQGIYDIAMFNLMPNMRLCMGANAGETRGLIKYALEYNDGPIAVRFPRLKVKDEDSIDIVDTKWQILRKKGKVIIITYGPDVLRLKELGLDAIIVNARFIRPMDTEMLDYLAQLNLPFMVYEQVVSSSSLAQNILSYYQNNNQSIKKFRSMAFANDTIVCQGSINEVLEKYGLGDKEIIAMYESLCD